MKNVAAVLGSGAFGTAVSTLLSHNNQDVVILPKFETERQNLLNHRTANLELKLLVPESVEIGPCYEDSSAQEIFEKAKAIFCVIPSKFILGVFANIKDFIPSTCPLVICSKGLVHHQTTHKICTLTTALSELVPNPLCVLSGPNLAREIVEGYYCASTVASNDIDLAKRIAFMLRSRGMSLQISHDMIGSQLCGAIKNVLAIAYNIIPWQNAKAALLTCGLKDLSTICKACHASSQTLQSLCGIGDIVLTCCSPLSRNSRFGSEIGKGVPISELLANQSQVVEGYFAAALVHELIQEKGIQAPVLEATYSILYDNSHDCIETLLAASQSPVYDESSS